MANNKPPLPFALPPSNGVPLVGQKWRLAGCVPVTTLICNCTDHGALLTIPGVMANAICPDCKKRYHIETIRFDRNTGRMEINFGVTTVVKEEHSDEVSKPTL